MHFLVWEEVEKAPFPIEQHVWRREEEQVAALRKLDLKNTRIYMSVCFCCSLWTEPSGVDIRKLFPIDDFKTTLVQCYTKILMVTVFLSDYYPHSPEISMVLIIVVKVTPCTRLLGPKYTCLQIQILNTSFWTIFYLNNKMCIWNQL